MSAEGSGGFEVPAGIRRERADRVLSEHLSDWSRSRVQKLFAAGLVWREDEAIEKSTKVSGGDCLNFTIPPERLLELRPVGIPLEILFEDDDLVVINKAAGMIVHPGAGTGEDTLVHALLHHCNGQLSWIGGQERPGIVHRLDRETSGVIVAAKSDQGYRGMTRLFAERQLEKVYSALASGGPFEAESGTIEAPIARHPVHRTRMAVRDEGRSARSDWTVDEQLSGGFSLVRVRIHTGRTHQIRVHLAHLGHPLAGDSTYGFKARCSGMKFPRVMLHAAKLVFTHPLTGRELTLKAPLPDDFSDALSGLRST